MNAVAPQPLPPSGDQLELRYKDQLATVVSCGGGLRNYRVAGIDIVDGYASDEVCPRAKGQLLMPWPNRVRDGRYSAGGVEHQLDLSEASRGNAIHGLVRWATWTAKRSDASSVTMEHDLWASHAYPFALRLLVTYTLGDDGLSVNMTAVNVSPSEAPYGAGAHPYIRAGDGVIDAATLKLDARERYLCDDRLTPVGTEPVQGTDHDFRNGRVIGDMPFDTCFTGLDRDEDGRARTVLTSFNGGEVEVWQDAAMDYVMLFSGDGFAATQRRQSLAIEPMTCAPNAFQSGQGLVWLDPGGTHVCEWGIRSRR